MHNHKRMTQASLHKLYQEKYGRTQEVYTSPASDHALDGRFSLRQITLTHYDSGGNTILLSG